MLGGKERSARRQEQELQWSGGGRDPVELEGGKKQNGTRRSGGMGPLPKGEGMKVCRHILGKHGSPSEELHRALKQAESQQNIKPCK